MGTDIQRKAENMLRAHSSNCLRPRRPQSTPQTATARARNLREASHQARVHAGQQSSLHACDWYLARWPSETPLGAPPTVTSRAPAAPFQVYDPTEFDVITLGHKADELTFAAHQAGAQPR